MSLEAIKTALRKAADPIKAEELQRFFKTGPGEYGHGDVFLGIRVPTLRKIAKTFPKTGLSEVDILLKSPIHEERFLSLVFLLQTYAKASVPEKKNLYHFYLDHTPFINNWDLVDTSAPYIVGAFLSDKSRKPLTILAKSTNLWERRIAVMATFFFIRQDDFTDALLISESLLNDKEDLIHKAVGWMLREIGNRNRQTEEFFLINHCRKMPRTMLRYAIEKFPESKRKQYLKGKIITTQSKVKSD
jgi:3-methyladenine DNA glycosylase AlkD